MHEVDDYALGQKKRNPLVLVGRLRAAPERIAKRTPLR